MLVDTLRSIHKSDLLLDKIKKIWIEHHQIDRGLVPAELKYDTKILDALSKHNPNLYLIFDWTNFSVLYLGKNVYEKIGYTYDELEENQFQKLFKLIKYEHLHFFAKVLSWDKIANEHLTKEMRLEHYSFVICGLTFKHKDGRIIKTIIRSYGLEINKNGFPIYGIIEISDISHLSKSDEYWMLVSAGKTNKKNLAFFSDETRNKGTSLISPRELEVIKLLEKGLSSKEIAANLFLSVETIDKHRKNMLGRVGATDTNALIELCKRSDIL
jgi:DNA-binding CsgD family transcriptional regulator